MLGSPVRRREMLYRHFCFDFRRIVNESAVPQSDPKKLAAKGEIMFKAKQWGVAAAMLLVAFGASASNFRVADQVYLPIAGHIQGGSSLFVSDVFISNLSSDAVQVSLI